MKNLMTFVNVLVSVGVAVIGGLVLMTGIHGYVSSEYITHQVVSQLWILIGCVLVLGALVLDRLPTVNGISRFQMYLTENQKNSEGWESEVRKYSGSTLKVNPEDKSVSGKNNLSGLCKPACECKKKI